MEENSNQKSNYWGIWATIGFSILILTLFGISQLVVFIMIAFVSTSENASMLDGSVLSIAALISGIVCIGLILLIIKLRRGTDIADYLNIKIPKLKNIIIWTSILTVFITIGELLPRYFEAFETDFMAHAYKTAKSLPLLYLSVGIIGPVFEELFFRGFLFKGLERSKIGGIGAVVVTSLIFAFIHTQYNFAILLLLIPVGLILGFARLKTGNLVIPIILHAINNIASIVITVFKIYN